MIQGLISAFVVRIPIVLIIGNMANAGMVELGLASSTATCAMLILGLAFYFIKIRKKLNKYGENYS
jgi:uncharacterized membrane protein